MAKRSRTPRSSSRAAPLSFDVVLVGDFLDELVTRRLALAEVAQLEATNRSARAAVLRGAAWGDCAARELLPKFALSGFPPGSAGTRVHQRLREVVAALRLAAVADRAPIKLRGLGQAEELTAAVLRAQGRAARFLAAGGRAAQVVVGAFRFPAGAAAASAKPQGPGDGGFPAMGTEAPLCASSRLATPPVKGYEGPLWNLRLAWLAGSMLMAAWPQHAGTHGSEPPMHSAAPTGEGQQQSQRQRRRASDGQERAVAASASAGADAHAASLVVDVHCVSADLVVRMHDVKVQADGRWVPGLGLCAVTGTRDAVADTLTKGLLSVVFIREEPCWQETAQSASNMHTLHFDAAHRPN